MLCHVHHVHPLPPDGAAAACATPHPLYAGYGHAHALFFASNVLTAVSLWVAARLALRIGLLNTMVFTHIPSSLFLIAMVFVPAAWLAILLWLLRAFFAQMDVPTSQSYVMAVVGPT